VGRCNTFLRATAEALSKMMSVLAVLYLVLGVGIVFVETRRVWTNEAFDALSLFNAAYFYSLFLSH